MSEIVTDMFYIAVFVVGLIIAVDFALEFRQALNGSPRAKRMYESMLADKDKTIEAQKVTIKELRDNLRACRGRIKALEKEVAGNDAETEG